MIKIILLANTVLLAIKYALIELKTETRALFIRYFNNKI